MARVPFGSVPLSELPRGDVPPPGSDIGSGPNDRKYVRVWTPAGWQYWLTNSPEGQRLINQAGGGDLAGSNVQYVSGSTVDPQNRGWNPNGYTEKDRDWSEVSPVQAASGQQAPQTPQAPAVGQPSVQNNPPGPPNASGAGVPKDVNAERGLGKGPWIRVTPYDGLHGDELGVDIVAVDSPLGRELVASGRQYPAIKTDYVVSGSGDPLPLELQASQAFQAKANLAGGRIVDYHLAPKGTPENESGADNEYVVKFMTPTGATATYRFATAPRSQAAPDGRTHQYIQTVGAQAFTGGTTDQQAALQAAQARQAEAQTALANAQVGSAEAKSAQEKADEAERELNAILWGRRGTNKDLDDALTSATTRTNTQAQTTAALQGVNVQTYNAVLQHYRDLGHDELEAQRLTQDYFVQRANIDTANNNLVLNGSKADLDAQVATNTQRTTLSNNRLDAANSGFTADANAVGQLVPYANSGKEGIDALLGMMGARALLAQKVYGGLAPVDEVIKPLNVPASIQQLRQERISRYGSLPDMDVINATRDQMTDSMGISPSQRPAPGPYVGTGRPVTNINPTPPAPVGTTASLPTTTQANQAARAANPQAVAAANTAAGRGDGNERPDDVITIVDRATGKVSRTISRAEWEASSPADKAPWSVTLAMPNPNRPDLQPAASQAPAPTGPTSGLEGTMPNPNDGEHRRDAIPQNGPTFIPGPQANGNERPDDVLTVEDPNGNRMTMTRSDWERLQQYPRVNPRLQVINAEPAGTRPVADPFLPPNDQQSKLPLRFDPNIVPLDTSPSAGLESAQAAFDEQERRRQRQLLAGIVPRAVAGLSDLGFDFGGYGGGYGSYGF